MDDCGLSDFDLVGWLVTMATAVALIVAVRRAVDLDDIVGGYEPALALNPQNAAANRRLGQIELSLAKYEDALDHLTAAFERTPWDNVTRQMLGEAYIANGRIKEGAALWSGINTTERHLSRYT